MTYIKVPLSDPDISYAKGDICYKQDDNSVWVIENECTKNGYVTVRGFDVNKSGIESVYKNYKPSELYVYETPSVETAKSNTVRSTQDKNKFSTYSWRNLYHEDDTVCEVKPDKVQHPPHYTKWAIQPRDFCMKNDLPFWMGSVLKYIMRAGEKQYDGLTALESEILDLEKAREFIEHRIRMIKT